MSPRTPDQFKKIRQDKRQLIEDAAIDLFANKGFHTTSISDIAKKAGISKGLMYNYFDGKEELLKSIIDKGIDEMMVAFDSNNDGVLTEEEFVSLINEFFRIIKEKQQYWKLLLSLFFQPAVMILFSEKLMEMVPKLINVSAAFFASKGYDDPETEAMFFGTFLDGVAFDYVAAPEMYPLEKMKQRLINMYTK